MAGDAEIAVAQCDQRDQPRMAVRRVAPGGGQRDDLIGQAVGDAVVGLLLDALEQQLGIEDPRHDAARDDCGLGGDRMARVAVVDPVPHQAERRRLGALDRRPPTDAAASRSRAARAPSPCSAATRSNGEPPSKIGRRGRRARTSPLQARRQSSDRRCASPAARTAARRRPARHSASAAAVSRARAPPRRAASVRRRGASAVPARQWSVTSCHTRCCSLDHAFRIAAQVV